MIAFKTALGRTKLVVVSLLLLMSCFSSMAQTAIATGLGEDVAPMALPPPPDPGDGPATNQSIYIRQSVPATMVANGVYNVSVTMQNYGTTTWDPAAGHVLGSQAPQDNSTWGSSRIPLAAGVPPGESITFTFQVRAPGSAGTYAFQWRMLQAGKEWFGAYSNLVNVTVRDPVNNAQPTAQSAPGQMETDKPYTVSVTMLNTGESTWTRAQQYTLMAQSPHNNTTWGFNRVPLAVDNVAPGQSAVFSFLVTAPATPGNYAMQWGMQREGYGSFGPGTTPLTVKVTAPVNNAQIVGIATQARMQTGRRYKVAVTVKNNGTTTWSAGALYRLGAQDNDIWGVGQVDVGTSVAPGQQYIFDFEVTAPAPGSYDMKWRMVQEQVQWFGDTASNPVTVTEDLSYVTFIHTDGLGSPVARTDGTGTVISRTRYEPYGYVASGATPTLGFTGHVNDADTGLTYMQQRYYDPVAGRFLSIDPVVTDANTGGSFNRYAYANNNPYRYVDPDGRMSDQTCRDMVGNCNSSGSIDSSSRKPSGLATAGAFVGALAGGAVAAGCDFYSAGVCAPTNPALIAGGATAGAIAGGVAGEMLHSGTAALKKAVTSMTGYLKPKYWSTHHIVAQDDSRAQLSRSILSNAGMNINDGHNGIFMHSKYHDRIHTSVYHAAVTNTLQGATTYSDVALRLEVIRLQINMGVFPW